MMSTSSISCAKVSEPAVCRTANSIIEADNWVLLRIDLSLEGLTRNDLTCLVNQTTDYSRRLLCTSV